MMKARNLDKDERIHSLNTRINLCDKFVQVSTFTQHSLNIHSTFTQHSLNIHATFTQHSLNIHAHGRIAAPTICV
jgi:hypothetical protein